MSEKNMVEALHDTLSQMMQHDPRLVLLGEDIGVNGGVFRVTDQLLTQFGSDRVIDTPLAESAIVGTALGMAIGGLRPVCEIQFLGFLYPALDQLISHVSRIRARSAGALGAALVIRAPFGGGIRAPEQHADSAEGYLTTIPGLKVAIPSSPADAKGLLIAAIEDEDPVVLLEPIRLYRLGREEVPDTLYRVPLGTARIVQPGRDVSVITYGAMVPLARAAATQLQQRYGWDVEIVDVRSLSPLDEETLGQSVRKTGRAVIVHEAPLTGGFGAEILATVTEQAFWWLKAPIVRVTGPDVPFPPYAWEDWYVPNVSRIAHAIGQVMAEE
ncbi:MAG: alpha-ketoacid dehydrogenase subunit beta [Sulfobacillus thermosulfidooxidans]|uniref:Alpha-ketoacid dehydrogenase subunit beta n=1 Tax=Sulfobacillus thermotolerans TaxID=338644 RepID=A0ABN5H1S2_9FIRM|nr:alpha-ketoacid dehydrogenase subunit beta [Sulfobacillus sp. hq2]AUW94642.1 alpha-ketoacid dehydrogenase subunit beta [Sulfobacillus thermotolerans]MCY0907399.1 alpha-ketoacid dehydrogenase subunit beta [Sulfobacillus thermotolerans]POB11490.1 alpha-ketoacid dehydrogenase subunit beta [Sulfobacillus sp. hq2]PSR37113.1 MAG: alpha-ketoacid dehydrogenase subunit beta [Sulfobacillus thermosulfidooxidans]